LKAQLVAPSKRAAVLMQSIFAELDEVKTEVVISPPDEREDENSADESEDETVKAFWKKMMALYGTESAYNSRIIEAFKGPGGPEMLIVVSKLLTGFDAPRNTVLYLARPLKEHTLLQAIARVNRVFDEEGGADKPFGYVIDYCGILKDLDKALAANAALLGFEEEDLAGTLTSLRQQAEALPQLYAALLSIFDGVANRYDEEPYARHLANLCSTDRLPARIAGGAGVARFHRSHAEAHAGALARIGPTIRIAASARLPALCGTHRLGRLPAESTEAAGPARHLA
jgi:type I restriction enzyme R subunit